MTSNTDPGAATFWGHVEELRKTLIRCLFVLFAGVILCFFFYKELFLLFTSPLAETQLIILGPLEGFTTMMKLSFWTGLVFTSPIWLYLITKFILPALDRREKSHIIPFFLVSFFFAGSGIIFAYFLTIPFANAFLQSFNADIGENLWTLQHYLDYTVTLLLAHGLAFELIAVLLFLLHFGVISTESLIDKRPHAIVSIFIIAAILTPPDVLTQLMLGIPMTLLYEGLILYGKFFAKKS